MGFFSWCCKGCGESIKAPYGIPRAIAWQNDAVCLLPNGSILKGAYDGYGSMEDLQLECSDTDVSEWWHEKCWIEADRPCFVEASAPAPDQGYFY